MFSSFQASVSLFMSFVCYKFIVQAAQFIMHHFASVFDFPYRGVDFREEGISILNICMYVCKYQLVSYFHCSRINLTASYDKTPVLLHSALRSLFFSNFKCFLQ